MEPCPCESGKTYAECCEPLIQGARKAESAEALMRSRYTAHAKSEIEYIYQTTHPSKRHTVNREQVRAWCKKSQWQGLEILQTTDGGPDDQTGIVEFVARYREKERPVRHHEIAEFVQNEGTWYFMDGQPPKPVQSVRQGPKIGRNDPCPCGSGKKYKKCCGA